MQIILCILSIRIFFQFSSWCPGDCSFEVNAFAFNSFQCMHLMRMDYIVGLTPLSRRNQWANALSHVRSNNYFMNLTGRSTVRPELRGRISSTLGLQSEPRFRTRYGTQVGQPCKFRRINEWPAYLSPKTRNQTTILFALGTSSYLLRTVAQLDSQTEIMKHLITKQDSTHIVAGSESLGAQNVKFLLTE